MPIIVENNNEDAAGQNWFWQSYDHVTFTLTLIFGKTFIISHDRILILSLHYLAK